MITYINRANASRYSELFEKANKALNLTLDSDKISSLEEYFSVIKTLVTATGDRKYTMLPLDEDVFEIDANRRLITVPNSFKTNGISVQGDQIAEVIYFKIDRFFDATDLNEMDIFIQWQAPNGDSGISKEWVRDIESETGKLIFGWPLSEEITVKSGNVKFAVRFVKFDESDKNEIVYSFSTLTAEAPIKPALDFDLSQGAVQLIDYNDLIINRLVDSDSPIAGAGSSERPEILFTLDRVVDLVPVEDGEGGEAALHVRARSIDAGNITYAWTYYKLTYNNVTKQFELATAPTEMGSGKIIYIQTKDKEIKAGKDYYLYYKEDGKDVVKLADTTDWAAYIDSGFVADKVTTIYERYCEYIGKDIGVYKVEISNKRGKAPAETVPGTKLNEEGNVVPETFEELGLICEIPAPAMPIISEIHQDNAEGKPVTTFVIAEKGKPVVLAGDIVPPEEIVLFAEAHADDEDEKAGRKPTYQWMKNGVDIEGATEKKLVVSEEGSFALKAFNTRNFHTCDIANTPRRISFPPINPTLGEPDPAGYLINKEIDASTFIVDDGLARADLSKPYAYKWYEKTREGKSLLADETSNKFTPTETGNYYVEVFSIYNGVTLKEGTMSKEIDVVAK